MKQIKVKPLKARVKGNLIPDFSSMENPPKYEDFHVTHQKQQTTTYQGVKKDVVRLSPQGEKLYMNITSDLSTIHPNDTATVTCVLYYKSGNNDMFLSGQTVYVYDNNNLVLTTVSDKEGKVVYELTTNVEGKHNITFRTLYSNGFDPATGSKEIVVYTKTELTLNPKSITIGHDEIVTLSGKLSTNSGIGLPSKPIILMEGAERTLATVITDEDGKYTYKYIESSNRGTPTVLTATSVPTLVQNTTNSIVGYLKTKDGTPVPNQKVRLYHGYSAYQKAQSTTDNNGKFTLKYKPTDSVEREYYIVFCSTVEDVENNQYEVYEPSFLSIGKQKIFKSPELKITNTVLTTSVNEALTVNVEVRDTSDSKVTFDKEKVLAQYSTNENKLLPPYDVNDWNYLEVSSYTEAPQGITSNSTGVVLGKYQRNIYKIPFKRSNKYKITCKGGWGAYIGLADNYTSPKKWETVYLTTSTGAYSQPATNIIEFEMNGENINIIVNGTTTTKQIPMSYGNELYLTVYQNNNNNPMEIQDITETASSYDTITKQTWVDIKQLTISKNKSSFEFSKPSAGTYYVRVTYNGNSEYVGGISEVKAISVIREPLNLSTVLYNKGTCHMIDNYPITTTVTNSKGNVVNGEIIKYYLNSETEENLMGTATTNTNGVATLIWSANPPNIVGGTYTVITKHEGNHIYEAKTVTNTLKVVKRTRQFSVTSKDSITVDRPYLLTGELTYTTHYTNYLLKCNNHNITVETTGLTQQPLLIDDWIQADLLTTSVTTNVEPYVSSEGLDVGQKGTVYYKFPITITDGLDVTYEFKLKLDTGANDGRLALLRLDENGNKLGYYDYWLPKATYGTNPTIRIHIVGNVLTLTHMDSGTLIRERELNTENGSDYYIGFLSSTAGKVIIEHMSTDLQPLIKYPIGDLANWYKDTYPGVDESTQNVQDAFIGDNGYVFQGIRKGFVLKRPIDLAKDKYIKVESYQKEVWMRVGLTTLDSQEAINTSKYQYVYLHQIGLETADLSNFSVFKYEFRVQKDNSIKAFINGAYIKTITFSSDETPYLCIYATSQNDYIKSVTIRQDTFQLKTSNGEFSKEITPAMLGEYVFNFTVETMDAYYALHRTKKLYSVAKEFPVITIEPLEVQRNQDELVYVNIPEDAYNEFTMKVYDSDDNEYIQEIEISNLGNQLEIDTRFDYPKGHYTYSIQYAGDDYYASVETEKQTLDIRDEMELTVDNEVSGVITAPAKSTVTITGTIIDSIGESFNGSLTISSLGMDGGQGTVTDGKFSVTLDLNGGFFPVSTGDHVLTMTCNDGYYPLSKQYTLNVAKLNTTITGYNTGVIINTNSLPRWQCKVPKDYKGTIYVYLVDEQGNYITGKASTSIITSTNGISSSDLHTDNIQGDNNNVNVWWEGRFDPNNTTAVNSLKNEVGVHSIKYVLINDSLYNNAESLATYYLRKPATITADTNIRRFEDEDVVINLRAYDPLGNALNGNLTVKIGSKSSTVQITNGVGKYTLPSSQRQYSNTNHITDVSFTYKYADSGYWAGCNKTTNCRTYNVKSNTYGIFMNAPQTTNFDNDTYLKLKSLGITDLYIRANTDGGGYVYLEAINHVISFLNDSNHRDEFRIHAVFNCVSDSAGTWYIGDDNKVTQERINDLKNHISNLLELNIEGICFDYIRRGSSTPDPEYEPDISNLVTELSSYVKENTPDKTVMISACMVGEYENAISNYGQNYEVFEDVCDYVIPMCYLYDYSSRNETTPVKSNGYAWQQKVIYGVYKQGKTNKSIPCITTYHGDRNASVLSDKEDLLYQIKGMWNYGLPDNKLKKSIILFRYGLLHSDCITYQELYDEGNDDVSIKIEPKFTSKTLKKASEHLQITWRTKWGGHVGSLGTATLKINGETQDVQIPVKSGTNLEIPLSLSKFKTGQHDVQIIFGGNNEYDVQAGLWNDVITLQ